jgi:hypothetical protein
VNPGGNNGYSAVLDNQSAGGAVLYYGNSSLLGWQLVGSDYEPYGTAGYWGAGFNNPKCLTADNNGFIYVADTGNSYVEEYNGVWGQHRWNGEGPGMAGVTFANPGGNFVSVSFKQPYAVACDAANPANVWVGDVGYNPSVIEEYSSGGTTIINAWAAVTGCVVHGITINPNTGNIYIADAGNNLVEVYSQTGTLLAEVSDPNPSAHELLPFAPSCIAFAGNYLIVGDSNNDFIDIFQ